MSQPSKDKNDDDEFGRPVESIMRCENFKSSFARRLSNRYTKPPISPKDEDHQEKKHNSHLLLEPFKVSDLEGAVEMDKDVTAQCNEEAVKSLELTSTATAFVKGTEVTAKNMEIETLRWQLVQTEANRQMHLGLLKQIVSFLHRIKDHMEQQKQELKKSLSTKYMTKARDEIPRSRSVLHVNKNSADFPMMPPRKLPSKRNYSSVNNVTGLKEFSNWNQSKLSLVPELNTERNIIEEITRLITLANTVLNTKLPELASCSIENDDFDKAGACSLPPIVVNEPKEKLDLILENTASNVYTLNTHVNSDTFDEMTNKYIETKEHSKKFLSVPSPLTSGFEDDFAAMKIIQPRANNNTDKSVKPERCENCVGNTFDNESGFSSMSSFQEIGIPIINIIPPSPNEDTIDDAAEHSVPILNGNSWNGDHEPKGDELPVKVFWV